MKAKFAAVAATIASTAGLACAPAFADTAPALDPAAVQATRQMMEAMHARATMVQTLQAMEQSIPAQLHASVAGSIERNPNMTAQQKADALAQFDKNAPQMLARMHTLFADPGLVDDMLAEMVPLYASIYSVDELHQLTVFYTSPVGQKMMATTPKVMGQMMEISNRVVQPRIAKALAAGAPAPAGQGQ